MLQEMPKILSGCCFRTARSIRSVRTRTEQQTLYWSERSSAASRLALSLEFRSDLHPWARFAVTVTSAETDRGR
jgi:hypothetical protein